MTERNVLFHCGSAEVYADGDDYRDVGGMVFQAIFSRDHFTSDLIESSLLRFAAGSDVGLVDGEPLDILLQCLEHHLASRNLAAPVLERTNALECLRNLRRWLRELEYREIAHRGLDNVYIAPDGTLHSPDGEWMPTANRAAL